MKSEIVVNNRNSEVGPFLKWAGGKRWLIGANYLPIPSNYGRYIEPFLGGGAVFFHLRPNSAILSDVNDEIICLYNTIKSNPIELEILMKTHQRKHSENYYYTMRSKLPLSPIERAARTLYLNRTCWNGLYRVNLKGEFNVPIGTKTTVMFENESFINISSILSRAEIKCADFEEVIGEAKKDDFVFLDPPYTVQHNYNGFIKYNEKIFSWEDQIRLRNAVEKIVRKGVSVVLTNADHASIRNLYKGLCRYKKVNRSSVLAGKADRRGETSEALLYANV
ncbi:MAG: Dam family site-specific DNA-(adenine-N6)-methyltransferase [Rhodospirillales bacterium]|nr:Dam family site-specific DNA-(adenine-N6)-methyltransferase [Rhodospirillales bacterium]